MLNFCRQKVGWIRIFEHNYSTSLCHPSCWWRKTTCCPWKHSWEQQQNKRREVGGYVQLSFFFPYSIFQDFFFFPETGNRAQIHKHSLYFVFLSQCCGSHMGWKVELTRSFGWALKKICFVYFLESQVRRNPTTETTRLSKRLVFYFLLRWHERLCLWAPTLHLQRPSTHTRSDSARLSKKTLELLNMCCSEPCQIFDQLLILERFSCFGSERSTRSGSSASKWSLRWGMNSGKPALTTLLAKLLDRSDFRSEKSLYFAKLREKGVFCFFLSAPNFFPDLQSGSFTDERCRKYKRGGWQKWEATASSCFK